MFYKIDEIISKKKAVQVLVDEKITITEMTFQI